MAHSKWKCDILFFVSKILLVLHCRARCCFAICNLLWFGAQQWRCGQSTNGLRVMALRPRSGTDPLLLEWEAILLGTFSVVRLLWEQQGRIYRGTLFVLQALVLWEKGQFICPTCSSYHSVSKPHPSSKYKGHDWSKWLHATGQANATKGRQKHKEVSRSGGSDMSQMPMWGGRLGFNRRPH